MLGNIFKEKDIIKILSSKKALWFAKNLRNKRLPSLTCQVCRGGMSLKEKWANILGSMLYIN
jgi:hypothetical protein